MLSANNIVSGYDDFSVINDIAFDLSDEIFTVLGANGSGKSTLLRTLARMLPLHSGSIFLHGIDVTTTPAHELPGRGLAYVPQEHNVFPALSVEENLSIGGRVGKRAAGEKFEEVYTLFPRLKERRSQMAGSLSGGEAQMLAVGRALMQEPSVLLLDEPSAGLSPLFVDILFESIANARRQKGMTIVLAEQNAVKALEIADRVMVLSLGRAHLLRNRDDVTMQDVMAAYHI